MSEVPGAERPAWRRGLLRTRLAQLVIGVGLAVAAFLVQFGLDEVVAVDGWLVAPFLAVFLATIVGGTGAGAVAGLSSWVLGSLALPAMVSPAQTEFHPIIVGLNVGIAFLVGLYVIRRPPKLDPAPTLREERANSRAAEAARQLEIVAGAVADLAVSRSDAQVADVIGRRLLDLSRATSAAVYLRPGSADPLILRASFGAASPAPPDSIDARHDGLIGEALGSGRWAADDGRVAVPVGAAQAVIGVVVLDRQGAELDRRAQAVANGIATLGAEAIERERLRAAGKIASSDAASAIGRMSGFNRLAADLAGALTVDDVGRLVVEYGVSALDADLGLLYVVDPRDGTLRLVHARGYPAGLSRRDARLAPDSDGPVTRAARSRQPVEIGSPEAWRTSFPGNSDLPAMTGTRSLVAWPIGDVERLDGVIVVGWTADRARSNRDRDVLASVAGQAAQAVERARLHAQEREAHQMQEAFISVISHELRTPITTILGGSRLLRRRITRNPAADEIAADIEAEADRLFRIVEDLLVLSRLERRNLSIAREPVHLTRLVERVVASEARRWPATHFVGPATTELRVVRGEETYIEQVLRNLLSNAAKYAPPESTVRVIVENDADRVAVRVLDEGPGIAREEVEQLFSLFYRSPSTAASAAGAGIGLFVSRRLVDEMGGRMWAKRRPGGGSEFAFALAAYPVDDDDEPEFDPRADASLTAPTPAEAPNPVAG